MKLDKFKKRISFEGENSAKLDIYYDNRGEPYREGITFSLSEEDYRTDSYVFMEDREAKALRDFLLKLYPVNTDYPQIFFAVKWAIENLNTDRIDHNDLVEIKKYADMCHIAYLKDT